MRLLNFAAEEFGEFRRERQPKGKMKCRGLA